MTLGWQPQETKFCPQLEWARKWGPQFWNFWETNSPLKSPVRNTALDVTRILALWGLCGTSDLQNCKMINLSCFKPLKVAICYSCDRKLIHPLQGLDHFALKSAIDEAVSPHLHKQNVLLDFEIFASLKDEKSISMWFLFAFLSVWMKLSIFTFMFTCINCTSVHVCCPFFYWVVGIFLIKF